MRNMKWRKHIPAIMAAFMVFTNAGELPADELMTEDAASETVYLESEGQEEEYDIIAEEAAEEELIPDDSLQPVPAGSLEGLIEDAEPNEEMEEQEEHLANWEEDDPEIPSSPIVLSLNEVKEASIATEDQEVYFSFVPPVSAEYSFYSLFRGVYDTQAVLYRKSGGTMSPIAENDDDINDNRGCQFRIDKQLTAGTTYILRAGSYDNSRSGNIAVVAAKKADLSTEFNVIALTNTLPAIHAGEAVTCGVSAEGSGGRPVDYVWYRCGEDETDQYQRVGTGTQYTLTDARGNTDLVCVATMGINEKIIYFGVGYEDHVDGTWKRTKEPTAVSSGTDTLYCSICKREMRTRPVAKLPSFITMNVAPGSTIPLKLKQSTGRIRVTGLQKGDAVVSWTSSNRKVASVSGSGKITGKKKGTAVITVMSAAGASYSFRVKVQKKVVKAKSISCSTPPVLKAGQTFALNAAGSPITADDSIKYSSSNKKVASVSGKGVIRAKKPGKTTITIKCGKKKKKIKVEVTK